TSTSRDNTLPATRNDRSLSYRGLTSPIAWRSWLIRLVSTTSVWTMRSAVGVSSGLQPASTRNERRRRIQGRMSRTPNRPNVDAANFIAVEVVSVYIVAQMAGIQNVDIANFSN